MTGVGSLDVPRLGNVVRFDRVADGLAWPLGAGGVQQRSGPEASLT